MKFIHRYFCLLFIVLLSLSGIRGFAPGGTQGRFAGLLQTPTQPRFPAQLSTSRLLTGTLLHRPFPTHAAITRRGNSLPELTSSSSQRGVFASSASKAITIAPGQSKQFDVKLEIQVEKQQVVVNEDTPTVSVDPSSNANSLVIKGKDLDALSDDPDELQNELNALAGPAAGPNGGQIYIDGFTAGQLPPKLQSGKYESIRIRSPPNTINSATAELKFSPSLAQTNFTDNSSLRATRRNSTREIPSQATSPTTTAINSTAR